MDENTIHGTINVQRLNIVEADGTMKLCLFNSQNIPPLMMDGEDLLPGHRQGSGIAGMMFFNTEGDECGGLVFASDKQPDGSYRSDLSMTFDQYKNDQVVQMTCSEENGQRTYGFRIYDRPDEHIRETIKIVQALREIEDEEEKKRFLADKRRGSAERMFIGKKTDGSVGLRINDADGNERVRIVVDADDVPHIELLDEQGNVTRSLL